MFREPQPLGLDSEPWLEIGTLLPERPILFPGGESNWRTLSGSYQNQLRPLRTPHCPAWWSLCTGTEGNREGTGLSKEAPQWPVSCTIHKVLNDGKFYIQGFL